MLEVFVFVLLTRVWEGTAYGPYVTDTSGETVAISRPVSE